MLGFALGVLATLTVLTVCLYIVPNLMLAFKSAMWKVRDGRLFVWATFDTYLRQRGWKNGPRLGSLTRQSRRRIAREMARMLV